MGMNGLIEGMLRTMGVVGKHDGEIVLQEGVEEALREKLDAFEVDELGSVGVGGVEIARAARRDDAVTGGDGFSQGALIAQVGHDYLGGGADLQERIDALTGVQVGFWADEGADGGVSGGQGGANETTCWSGCSSD